MKTKYILILSVVFLSTCASALTITPNPYTTTQSDVPDRITFIVRNTSNETVNVTIRPDDNLEGKIYFNITSFSIEPNSTYTVSAFLSRTTPLSGDVFFNNDKVSIEVQRVQSNLTVIPGTPSAGKGLVILLQNQSANGYMFVYETNNVYPISVQNGVGYLSLSNEDYGNAIIVVYGKKIYSKTIYINPPEIGSLYLIAPKVISLNENATFAVYADGEPVKAKLKFSGADSFTVKTNKGVATVRFRKAGNYTVTAVYFNHTCTRDFSVMPKALNIQVPSSAETGTTIQIRTEPNAKITIKKGDTTWTYTTNSDGICFFTPPYAGAYDIIAETENARGHTTFTAKTDTNIIITSSEGTQVNKIREGDVIMLQVVSSDNSQPSGSIDVFTDGKFHKSLIVNNGVTLWKVDKSANSYEFRFNPTGDGYDSSDIFIQGEKTFNYAYVWAALGILAVVAGLYYAYNKGLLKIKLPSGEKYRDLI